MNSSTEKKINEIISCLNDMNEIFIIEMIKHVISVIRKYVIKSLLNDMIEKFMIESE